MKELDRFRKLTESKQHLTESVAYHVENKIPLHENVYRLGSAAYFALFREAREAYKKGLLENLHPHDEEMLAETDIGEFVHVKGLGAVPLDFPISAEEHALQEAEYQGKDVELNKPMKGGSNKPYKVYVKNDKGNVVKVEFGSGMKAKLDDPEAKENFKNRHNCEQKKDKTSAGYWSCRLPRYAKSLGLKGGGRWW